MNSGYPGGSTGRLPRLHDVQVMIDLDLKVLQERSEQVGVLAGVDGEGRIGIGRLFQHLQDRRQLDEFGAGAEDHEDPPGNGSVPLPDHGARGPDFTAGC
jgi:hypothetical protein